MILYIYLFEHGRIVDFDIPVGCSFFNLSDQLSKAEL